MTPVAVTGPLPVLWAEQLRAWVRDHATHGTPVAILGDHRELDPLGEAVAVNLNWLSAAVCVLW